MSALSMNYFEMRDVPLSLVRIGCAKQCGPPCSPDFTAARQCSHLMPAGEILQIMHLAVISESLC